MKITSPFSRLLPSISEERQEKAETGKKWAAM